MLFEYVYMLYVLSLLLLAAYIIKKIADTRGDIPTQYTRDLWFQTSNMYIPVIPAISIAWFQ